MTLLFIWQEIFEKSKGSKKAIAKLNDCEEWSSPGGELLSCYFPHHNKPIVRIKWIYEKSPMQFSTFYVRQGCSWCGTPHT
jgi:hypothetical protein